MFYKTHNTESNANSYIESDKHHSNMLISCENHIQHYEIHSNVKLVNDEYDKHLMKIIILLSNIKQCLT